MEGRLHVYHPAKRLNLFEYLPYSSDTNQRILPPKAQNVLLFIGGLFDTFNSPDYVSSIAGLFPLHQQQKWRVMHVQLSSTIRGWGISDIDQDIDQIGRCVDYIRDNFGDATNVILMGHSTGCQDTIHYLTAPNPQTAKRQTRPKVQGAILQAPVSDREGIEHSVKESAETKKAFQKCMQMIEQTPESERRNTILPMNLMRGLFGPAPVSMSRFLSLASPGSPQDPSAEDFFSSDLLDERLKNTFGKLASNGVLSAVKEAPSILILISDADEHMPDHVDKQKLLAKWKSFIERGGAICSPSSASIANAIHDIGGDSILCREARLLSMRGAILDYLESTVGGIGDDARKIYSKEQNLLEKEKQDSQSMEKSMSGLKL